MKITKTILTSMFLNFIVVACQINKKYSAMVVSFTGTLIVLQVMVIGRIVFL